MLDGGKVEEGLVQETLLKMGSDDHTQNWCELVATVSTPICSVMFTPTMQYTTYHLCEQFVRD